MLRAKLFTLRWLNRASSCNQTTTAAAAGKQRSCNSEWRCGELGEEWWNIRLPVLPPPVSDGCVTAVTTLPAAPAPPSVQLQPQGDTGRKTDGIDWSGLSIQIQPRARQKTPLPLECGFWSLGSVLQPHVKNNPSEFGLV